MGATRRKFTLEFKTEAAHRVIGTGRTVVEVAGELSVDKGSLPRWAQGVGRRLGALPAPRVLRYNMVMPVRRLNHAVLYVRDADATAAFYERALGFERLSMGFAGAVFMRAPGSTNDHDLGLFSIGAAAGPSPAGRQSVGLYHLAWEVDTLTDLEDIAGRLRREGALVGASDHSTTKSLYGKDPDGIEFEVAWVVPAAHLDEQALAGRSRIGPLDIEREKQRYGALTRGGVGVSDFAGAP